MGDQDHAALGAEWLVTSIGAGAVYVSGYLRARTGGGSRSSLSMLRTLSGTGLYVAQVVGSIVFLLGAMAGLYVGRSRWCSWRPTRCPGAWLLLVGVHQGEHGRDPASA
jgi:hypothetical protein